MLFFSRLSISLLILFFVNSAFSQSEATKCPLANKRLTLEEGSISYLEGGSGKTILLVHGLFGQKEQWLEVGCAMALLGFNVIAPDLPGYGQSTGFPISVYPLHSQVDILHKLMLHLGKSDAHIAGSSMGGAIAALYTKKYSSEIKSLAFIGAPLGVIGWSSKIREAIFEGVNPFIPINEKQFDLEMRLLFFDPPKIDEQTKAKLIKGYVENNRHYQQVWDIVNFYDRVLVDIDMSLPRTLILWGEQDGIFSIDGISILKKSFKNAEITQFQNTAHLLMLEQPQKVVEIYHTFLKK
jgi:abhydrolase domain-containing protein 6